LSNEEIRTRFEAKAKAKTTKPLSMVGKQKQKKGVVFILMTISNKVRRNNY
jgi:hypothetical protein